MQHIQSPLAAASLAALLILAGCESEPEVVGEMADPQGGTEQLDPAELPPMETGSRSYRCADNSVVYVTFFTNDTQVGVATERGATQTILPAEAAAAEAPAEGEEAEAPAEDSGPVRFSGEGYVVIGTGETIQFQRPGGSLQRCNA